MYHVFTRTWWRKEGKNYVPHLGRKTTLGYARSIEEAREMCAHYNDNIKGSNPTGREAEFQKD